MTTMLMGYKRPEYLAKIGRIQASEWTIDMLEDAIEQQTPYISDYFWDRDEVGGNDSAQVLYEYKRKIVIVWICLNVWK